MSALLAFFVALVLSVLGHGGSPSVQGAPVPQEHVVTHALPGQVSHTPEPTHQVPPRPTHPPILVPAPVPAPDPAPQLPDEVIGRAIDCGDGSVGYVTDAQLDTDCGLPPDQRRNPAAP